MTDSLYSNEIRQYLHSLKWPKGLRVDIAERMTEDTLYLQFILYRDNFETFDGVDKQHIAMQLKEFMEKVRSMGVPIYLEVAEGDGRAKS